MVLLRSVVALSTLVGLLLVLIGTLDGLNRGDYSALALGIALLFNALIWHVANRALELLSEIRHAVVRDPTSGFPDT